MRKRFYNAIKGNRLYPLVVSLLLFTNFAFSQEKTATIKGRLPMNRNH